MAGAFITFRDCKILSISANKWGLAEDLGTVDDVGFTRRRGPNFDSEDDLIL